MNNQGKRRKGFFYYVKLDFQSLQGKASWSYLSISIVTIAIIITAYRIQRNTLSETEYLANVISNSKYLVSKVEANVLKGQFALESTSNNLNSEATEWEVIWENDVSNSLEQLKKLSNQWRVSDLIVLLDRLNEDIYSIKNIQEEIRFGQSSIDKLQQAEYLLLINNLRGYVDAFEQSQNQIEEQIRGSVAFSKQNTPYVITILYVLGFAIGGSFGTWAIIDVMRKIRNFRSRLRILSNGDFPEDERSKDEFNSIHKALNELVANMKNITQFSEEVGAGNFESEISVFNNNGVIGGALVKMRNSLQEVSEQEKLRTWTNEGLSRIGLILRSNNNLKELCQATINELIAYLEATQGAVYLVNKMDSDKVFLELTAFYAYDREKYGEAKILPGQGLVGQTYLEKEKIYLRDIPQDYLNVTSGLGKANPNNLIIIPIKRNEEILGIIEIASFRTFEDYQIEFLEKAGEGIATTVASAKGNAETERLLTESQVAAEQLRTQEEEMRQNAEELNAQQEEMMRQMKESDDQRHMFESLLDNVEGVIYRSSNDALWTKIFISSGIKNLTGYSAEEFIANERSFSTIIHEDDLKSISEQTAKAISNDQPFRVKYRMRNREGGLINVVETGRGVVGNSGQVEYIDGFISQVHESVPEESLTA